jgi:uncharacterized protein (DUF433 family)
MATKQPVTGTHSDDEETYQYLERRAHSWRREPVFKGRTMTVSHVVYGMRANQLSIEAAAEDFGLPVEAIREALTYYERHRELIEADVDELRRRIEDAATVIGPTALPR